MKLGRCIKELERIYGIAHGGDRGNQYTVASGQNVSLAKTQEDLAEEMGITKKQLQRLKSLTDLIPELQDAVQTLAVKLGRCIKELERIYGIRNGGDRRPDSHNEKLITQSDLAEQLNISKAQLNRLKSLTDLIPELQDAVQTLVK